MSTIIILFLGASEAFQNWNAASCRADTNANLNTNANANTPRFLAAQKDDNDNGDDMCGDGFYKQTGADGDYCVFDYEAVSRKFGTDKEHQVADADHYWDKLERQNKARKRFGLKPLTPEQFVALEAQNRAIGAQQISEATSAAFEEFDVNNDGVITLAELRQGLEKMLRTELSNASVQKVMDHFDSSGDGLLQADEFVTLDQLRNQIEIVTKQERKELAASGQPEEQAPGRFQTFLNNLAFHFEDSCESNFDCQHPEVCCDFAYKKMCCSSGKMAKDMELEYATIPVPQNYN